jgi:cyclic lactone autoinducer peptide
VRKVVLAAVAGILASLAFASVAGACIWGWYQPLVPKALER